MAERSNCIVCGGTAVTEFLQAKDFLVSDEVFILKRCSQCGFIFTANPPDERELGQYYLSEDYISHSDRKRNFTDIIYHIVRRIMLGRKRSMITKVCQKPYGNLLDIGCGTGYFAGYMKEKKWDVTGIEISERARKYAFSKFGIEVLPPDMTGKLPDHSFDCITLWHVIEHFADPYFWLNEISRLLTDEGKCVLAMPNIRSADARWFDEKWAAIDVPRHLWHFSPETFTKMIEKANFRCVRIKGMPFDVFYISVLSYKNSRKRLAFVRGILTGGILSVRNILSKDAASSLIYVIEKNKA